MSLKNREGETPLECCSHNSKVWSTLQASRRLKESRGGRVTFTEKLLNRYGPNTQGVGVRTIFCILHFEE